MIVKASKSLWHEFGPMGVASGPLRRSESIDLIVVGGGILGLSTALHAAGAGLSIRVVEAGEIGEQASGLNGGQVIPGLKYDPSSLRALFGEARGERIIAFAASTADKVFDLILNLRLDVPQRRSGWIQAAHEPKAARSAETRASEWRQCGADVAVLNGAEITSLTGACGYVGGWIDRRAGIIQPLAYTRELARAAIENGAKIATGTRVTRLLQNIDGWVAETTLGYELRARSVVVATNAYTDNLIPGCARASLSSIRSRSRPPHCRPTSTRRSYLADRRFLTVAAFSATSADRQTAGWSSAGEAAWQNRIGRKLGVTSSAQCVGPIPTSPKCR